MNKIVVGLLFGLVLGALDGATAWFYPETRPVIGGILSGWFARKVHSTGWGIAVGSMLGLLFAFLVAFMDAKSGKPHYLEIMLPGFVVGAIVGFLTQRMGTPAIAKSGAQ